MKCKSIILLSAAFITLLTACNNKPTLTPEELAKAQPTPYTTEQTQVAISSTPEAEQYYWEGSDPDFSGYPEPPLVSDDAVLLAKTVWGEARGCALEEQRLVVWTVFQRVDAGGEFRNYNTIAEVVTKPKWFVGYNENNPIDPDIYNLCYEELTNWWNGEKPPTHAVYAPTTPYYFFDGDGTHNWFRKDW